MQWLRGSQAPGCRKQHRLVQGGGLSGVDRKRNRARDAALRPIGAITGMLGQSAGEAVVRCRLVRAWCRTPTVLPAGRSSFNSPLLCIPLPRLLFTSLESSGFRSTLPALDRLTQLPPAHQPLAVPSYPAQQPPKHVIMLPEVSHANHAAGSQMPVGGVTAAK